eukprot:8249608-Pyramimonas_sp.AAC.1
MAKGKGSGSGSGPCSTNSIKTEKNYIESYEFNGTRRTCSETHNSRHSLIRIKSAIERLAHEDDVRKPTDSNSARRRRSETQFRRSL